MLHRTLARVLLLLAAVLPVTVAADQGAFLVQLTVLEPVDASTLPAAVQRLEQAFPGYAAKWAHARDQLPVDPVRAIELLREAQRPAREGDGFERWEGDFVRAGQALFLGWKPGAGVRSNRGASKSKSPSGG